MAADFIPNKFYVARQPRNRDTPDEILGFMQPMHKQSWEKRKETADKWARGYSGTGNMDPIEVENVPLTGFSLTENKRRYMNKNVVWRVLHPAGFEFEISSDNFSDFLMEVDLCKGIIQTPMLFVRRGQENYLTYEGSDVHKAAVTQAMIETKISIRDILPGDKVTLKSGQKFTYAGAFHILTHFDSKWRQATKPVFDAAKHKSYRSHYFWTEHGSLETVDSPVIISIDHRPEEPFDTNEQLQHVIEYRTGHSTGHLIRTDTAPMTMSKMHVEHEDVPFQTITQTDPLIAGAKSESFEYVIWLEGDDTPYLYRTELSCGYYNNTPTRTHTIIPAEANELKDGSVYYTAQFACVGSSWCQYYRAIDKNLNSLKSVKRAIKQVITRP